MRPRLKLWRGSPDLPERTQCPLRSSSSARAEGVDDVLFGKPLLALGCRGEAFQKVRLPAAELDSRGGRGRETPESNANLLGLCLWPHNVLVMRHLCPTNGWTAISTLNAQAYGVSTWPSLPALGRWVHEQRRAQQVRSSCRGALVRSRHPHASHVVSVASQPSRAGAQKVGCTSIT